MESPKIVLFVCTGNVCRSPMAAAFFERQVQVRGLADQFGVRSAGTWALENNPASPHAQTVLGERGLDLSAHRGRTITLADVREAAVILVMTQSQRDALIAEFPDSRSRIHLMSELVGQVYDIADPYGASRAEYEVCADELDRLIQRGWTKILEWAQDANPSRTNPNLMQTAERVSPYA